MRRRLTLLTAGLSALTLAACGGDDDGGGSTAQDEEAIRTVLVQAITSDDPQVECVTAVTPQFVKTVYGSEEACRKAEAEPEKAEDKATGADVTNIRIDGDKATADVTVKGGTTAGASGPISFAKDGDTWKVDGLSVGFLRSQIRQGLANSNEEPFDDREFTACFRQELDALPDDRFRQFAYDSIADRERGQQLLTSLVIKCQGGGGEGGDDSSSGADTDSAGGGDDDLSFIRRKFEEGIEEEARKDGVPAERITCIKRELRERISDDEIVKQATEGGGKAGPEITQATAEAIQACS